MIAYEKKRFLNFQTANCLAIINKSRQKEKRRQILTFEWFLFTADSLKVKWWLCKSSEQQKIDYLSAEFNLKKTCLT